MEEVCVSIVKKIKDAFGWAGDIRTETRIGAWTGELPSYLRMVGEADSNIEGISTAPAEKIDTDMRTSAHDIASYQVNSNCLYHLSLFSCIFFVTTELNNKGET